MRATARPAGCSAHRAVASLQPPHRHCVSFACPAEVLKKEKSSLGADMGRSPRIHLELAPELPSVPVDAETLRLLLGQLLENAREAMQREGVVTLQSPLPQRNRRRLPRPLRPLDAWAVRGNSRGRHRARLSDEAQRSLFAVPFFSTKPGTRPRLGDGLWIDPRAWRRLGIRLGAGTRHSGALVPADDGRTPRPRMSGIAGTSGTTAMFQGQKVLVVDDDSSILHFVRTTLEQGGFRVQATTSPVEALAAFQGRGQRPVSSGSVRRSDAGASRAPSWPKSSRLMMRRQRDLHERAAGPCPRVRIVGKAF